MLCSWRSGTSVARGDPRLERAAWLLFGLSNFILILHISGMECALLISFEAAVGKHCGHIDS